jgi:dihydroflavonol-4-reductase
VGEKTVILVTGANGFLGSWIARTLVERGHRVRAFVRARADLRNLAPIRDQIEIATGDILDVDSLRRVMHDCRALIHTAGSILTHPRDGERAWAMHYTGAVNAFNVAQEMNLERIVYTASIFTLGAGWRERPADEEHGKPFAPKNFRYHNAKVAAQKFAEEKFRAGLPIVFVYPTFCFGPNDINLSSQKELVDYLRGRLPAVTDAGINIVDVRDAALGHVLALERGECGRKYLIAGTNSTFYDLFKRASAMAGHTHRLIVFPRQALLGVGLILERVSHEPIVDFATAQVAQEFWYYQSERAERELGFHARPLDTTLRDAIAWFRDDEKL